jgi:hypothetical protein
LYLFVFIPSPGLADVRVVRSSTQQTHIDAPVERVWELVIGVTVFGALASAAS